MSEMNFDELYVVSDLHFGGLSGFQIFSKGDRLAATIKRLARKSPNKKLGLVLNGDIVDFLAEGDNYLDPKGAIGKLERVFALDDLQEEKAFFMVWQALQDFVDKQNRRLVLVLGNHDVELALPQVVEWLLQSISRGIDSARGRISVHVDGAGFACRVKDKDVLCVHGNEADDWNFVDYRQLLKISEAMNRRQTIPEWDANAGTRLVIDVMNGIKKKFPVVDLLKPETKAALPSVLALDPGAVKKITKLLKVTGYLGIDKFKRRLGFLSTDEALEELGEDAPDDNDVLADFLKEYYDYGTQTRTAQDLLKAAFESDEEDELSEDDEQEFLGPIDFIKAIVGKKENQSENMRKALKDWLEADKTFNLCHKDDIYQKLDELCGDGMDFLVAGHTHLERAFERSTPGRFYFNSGTWIRLIRLTEDILEDQDDFKKVWNAFGSGKIENLDKLNDLGANKDQSLILNISTVVCIVDDDEKVYGELCHAGDDGVLTPVAGTRFPQI